jgi:hypothetical protein
MIYGALEVDGAVSWARETCQAGDLDMIICRQTVVIPPKKNFHNGDNGL